ncbi:hypothetical protein ACHHYP_05902, partial [Achlya hypogyna]
QPNWHKTTDVKPHSYSAKPFDEEYDIEIKVTHCGICGSDLHTITGGWGAIKYPLVVGHEIIGHVVRVGSKVDATKFGIGTRVGVGAQCASCLDCRLCDAGKEQMCPSMLWTYGSTDPSGYVTQGGYADYYRCHAKFVVPIPEGLSSESAAPMMCAGVTTYSPLKAHGAGPGKKVGIIGIGGLGHLAIQWANGSELRRFATVLTVITRPAVVSSGLAFNANNGTVKSLKAHRH